MLLIDPIKKTSHLFFFFCFPVLIIATIFFFNTKTCSNQTEKLLRLKEAYPEFIQAISDKEIIWNDGTIMPTDNKVHNITPQEILDSASLFDQMNSPDYQEGVPKDTKHFIPTNDSGRIRHLPFFKKMYGQNEEDVKKKLVTIHWMPKFFSNTYPLEVTTVNNVDQKLLTISRELERLVKKHPEYLSYLSHPGGTFYWRKIANTHRQSMHSFGMTIDINPLLADYWQWDLIQEGRPVGENEALIYRNHVPWEIVSIFERQGFIWGGKWYHYDTMHFEYRPELFKSSKSI